MNEPADTSAEAARIDVLFREKARAEVDAAEALVPDAGVVRGQGDLLADVLLVKGDPGPRDAAKKRALAGDDGVAIGRALDALGLSSARFALCTRIGSPGVSRIERVRLMTEAIDPRTVVLLDAEAAEDFAAAFGCTVPAPGELTRILGREVVAVDGFAASLSDDGRKRRVWRQLKVLEQEDRS